MNTLMNFENTPVEVFEHNGQILFNPYDCGKCLDISAEGVRKAITRMSDKQVIKMKNSNVANSHFRKLHNTGENFLTESGVYKLIFKSRKEYAEKFQDWVTDEVLPTIRKHGAYMTNDTLEQALTSPDFLIELATKLKEEREKRQLVERELKDKNDFINQISASAGSILVRDLAHLITKNTFTIGEKRLWNKLREWNFICKESTKPKQNGLERGFFEVSEFAIQTNHGIKLRFTTRVTGKGQKYIITRLIEEQRKKEKEVACTK